MFKRSKFKINDNVGISKYKQQFEKGYIPNWSAEIFIIKTIKIQIRELNELMKTKFSHTYLVEKVIRMRRNRVYVKRLRFSSEHNSRINANNISQSKT